GPRVVQVVQAAGAGRGHAVERGVEAVTLGAGAGAGLFEAVVDLAEVAGAVAALAQQLGQHGPRRGRERGVGEPVAAPALLVRARDEPCPGGRADGGGDVGAVEAHPLGGEAVQVRGAGVRAAARGEIAVAVVVGDDQQDVGAVGRGGGHEDLGGSTGRWTGRPTDGPGGGAAGGGGAGRQALRGDAAAGRSTCPGPPPGGASAPEEELAGPAVEVEVNSSRSPRFASCTGTGLPVERSRVCRDSERPRVPARTARGSTV